MGHYLFPLLSSCSWMIMSALGLQALIYLCFSSCFILIDLYYDNLGVVRGVCMLGSETGQMLHQHVPWCPLKWRMDALPFVDIPFQLLVVFSFISLSLFCPRLETHAYKYSAPGSSKEEQSRPGHSCSVLFPPLFILASSTAMCFKERAGHAGPPYYFLLDTAANTPPPSLNSPLSSSLLGLDLHIHAQ
jgi:hypothetical protein